MVQGRARVNLAAAGGLEIECASRELTVLAGATVIYGGDTYG